MRVQYAALVCSLLALTVVGQKFENGLLNETSCVALEEFQSCRIDALNNLSTSCLNNSERGSPCLCQGRAEMLNCFRKYCWNYIYGCEYQETISQLLLDCFPDPVAELETIPFWPAPPEGPGICSCNFASMEQDLADAQTQYDTCVDIRANDASVESLDCYCCSLTRTLSITIDVCPKTDFPNIRFSESNETGEYGKIWFDCAPVLARVDCLNIGYKALPSATIYQPSNLPLPGTEPRSNLPGQLSTPLSGWTYTWSLGMREYVVTAFSPTGSVISITTTSVSGSGTSSVQASTTRNIETGPTITGTAAPSSTRTSSGSFGRTRPLRSHDEQLLVIVLSLFIIVFLVAAGMYF